MNGSPFKSRAGNSKPSSSTGKTCDSSSMSKKLKKSIVDKSENDLVRLHITPLTSESAKAIVPAERLHDASYHTIETFPEKSYGFVTVPRSEADKLKKKYNGTVFRGIKMSVEEARP